MAVLPEVAPVFRRLHARSGAGGHRRRVPEVTFASSSIAPAAHTPQHGGMQRLRPLLEPLSLAAWLAMAGIALSLRAVADAQLPLAVALLALFALAFAAQVTSPPHQRVLRRASELAMPLCALGLVALAPRLGTAQILLVVWVGVVAMVWPPRATVLAVLAAGLAVFLLLQGAGHPNALLTTILYASFQGFAGLLAHYARTAEHARDRLAAANAELLATRALLAESARDGERLRVARELHDVAGHKLTALRLNLRAMHAAAPSPELELVERLSAELLADIRGVVHALRDGGALDIDTALRALAAPFPRPALRLHLGPSVAIADPQRAETVLRTVQEALTNAARHGQARVLDVRLQCVGDALRLSIEDDGQASWPLREGHGLTGMRERIAALGGHLHVDRAPAGGLRLQAELPA
jgi:signal transduction histidine kinase